MADIETQASSQWVPCRASLKNTGWALLGATISGAAFFAFRDTNLKPVADIAPLAFTLSLLGITCEGRRAARHLVQIGRSKLNR